MTMFPREPVSAIAGRRTARARIGALVVGAALFAASPGFADELTGWTEATLPGGRAGLLPRLDISASLPRALVAGAVIRAVHGTPASAHAPGPLAEYFAAPPSGTDETVPIPLPADLWQQELLARRVPERDLLGAILLDRRLSLLCYGLASVDAGTLAWLGGQPDLLRRLRDRHAGAFAAFGGVVRVRDGVLVLPGDDGLTPLWVERGIQPGSPAEAIERLLGTDDGRLAYFVATLDGLPSARIRFLTGSPALPRARRRVLVSDAYQTFKSVRPVWRVNDFPFTRPPFDPALLATTIEVGADGQVDGSRVFWQTVLESRDVPGISAFGDRVGGTTTAGWLLGYFAAPRVEEREERFHAIHYVQRMRHAHPGANRLELARLGRAFRAAPALMLAVERIGIRDVSLQLAAARHAVAVSRAAGDPAARDNALALFQGPTALVAAAVRRGALAPAAAERLLRGLIEIAPGRGQARRLTAWFDGSLLPALGYDPSLEGVPRESVLLEALAGLRAAMPDPATVVTWEGQTYRVDPAAPELVRLTEVRLQQEGNTLDVALALARTGASLAAAATVDEVRQAEHHLTAVREALLPLQASEMPGVSPPPRADATVEAALSDLDAVRTPAHLPRVGALAARLAPLEDAVLADVLSSIVYALALGPADSRLFIAGNVARRHDFGTRDRPDGQVHRTAWIVPHEVTGSGHPWHVRGSLLALDVGLAHLQLRPTRVDLPHTRPRLSEMDRRALTTPLVLMDPVTADPQQARRLVTWLEAGRRALDGQTSPSAIGDIAARLDLSGHRRAALAWSAIHDPAAVTGLLLLGEILVIGRAGDPAPVNDWGVAATPLTGCLCLVSPRPPAWHRYAGRPASGLLPARVADPLLAILEGLADRDLPLSLAPGVLQPALYDFMHAAQLGDPDDWWSYSDAARGLAGEVLADYVAALTAGGALVPVAASSGPQP